MFLGLAYLFGAYIILNPDYYTRYVLQLVEIPNQIWRLKLLGYLLFHLILCFLFEYFISILELKLKKYLTSKPLHDKIKDKND